MKNTFIVLASLALCSACAQTSPDDAAHNNRATETSPSASTSRSRSFYGGQGGPISVVVKEKECPCLSATGKEHSEKSSPHYQGTYGSANNGGTGITVGDASRQ